MMVLLRVRGERLRRDKRMAEASPATLGRPLHSARYGLLHARQDELRQDQSKDGKPSRGNERQQPQGKPIPLT